MSHEIEFNGKNVLVVGGSSGIGNAVAQAFLAKGAIVTSGEREPMSASMPARVTRTSLVSTTNKSMFAPQADSELRCRL